ncbi:MAG TPA: hypothetical protein VL752_12325 [Acidisoma sp.]|uniref:hypothetical protein n=1 Tax=Acidisoma sp. TaxID=1872115 RepID=UPI002CE95222|nr:hypothetical protein [Acidisoma sp.]HTI01723.1 hypothetical protein [Acidisoma sp.]
MSSRIITRVAPGLIAGLAAVMAVPGHQAYAQSALPQPTSMGPVVQGGNGNQRAQPAAPGLPGARNSGPIQQGNIDSGLLSPNDELFDAIYRGDIGAARDALARGADLEARDAVGQTPVDVSIALGRNNITFLLVTMLKAGGGDLSEPQGPMAQPPSNALGMSAKDQKAVSTPVSFFNPPPTAKGKTTQKSHYRTAPKSVTPAAEAPAPSYAGGTGAPVPAAGFVGFGASAQ